ncbi:MAG: SusC/RagA family TonB-linked outer membrane protein [Bacteroidales bacterium]|nr:SusC/RagA family TonB-linked outer membrane protein [Bacteroidales bacterium]
MKFRFAKYIFFISLFFIGEIAVYTQVRTITGVVTGSPDNLPIPGSTIIIPGTTVGTITNNDGEFSIDVPAGTGSLEIRFIGMETQIITLGDSDFIEVIMQPELIAVDEVVVTALGISREAKSLGYSMTAVNSDELTEGSDRSALNAMQGKVAGVNITSASGAPGSSTRILVRGVSSLTGSNQPLFVIDGVPVSNSHSGSSSINGGTDFGNKVNDLNPDDIESVSILKGASGTALYGSRAANGVIIITTKKGELKSKSRISYSSSYTIERPLRLVQYQNEYGQGIFGNSVLYENMSWGPEFDNRFRPWGHEVNNTYRVKAYRALPDNVREFFETGKMFNNSISVDGGNEAAGYYFSYSNIQWDGIFPTDADSYSKHTFALRSTYKVTKRLSTSASVNYIRKKSSFVPTGQGEQSVYNQVMQTPRDISLRELADLNNEYNNIDNHYSLYTVNPYFILENNGNINTEDRIFGSLDLDYIIATGLELKLRLGGDNSSEGRKIWRARIEPEGNNEFSAVFDPGMVGNSSSRQVQLNSDLILSYNKEIKNFTVSLLTGHSLNHRYAETHGETVQNLSVPGFINISNSVESPSAFESSSKRRLVGVFGSADFSYKSLLFFSATARNEWSSTLPPQNNSYFFPGANAGLIFTEMFPGIQDFLSYGKVRVSWARVGNDAPPYFVNSVFEHGYHSDGYGYLAYPLTNGNINSYDVGDLIANENLKPEITDEYEVGTDLRFFNGRFSTDLAYYNKSTTDLIWATPVPSSSGYTFQMQNLGKITNYGVEALVTVVPVRNNNLRWELTVNFTRNYNELNYLNNQLERAELNSLRVDGGQQINWSAIPGMPVGVFEARAPMYTEDGQMVVNNQGLPVADEDLKIYGNSQYKYFGGVISRLNYKNISVSVHFDFRKGGLMYSRTKDITLWAGTVPATLYNERQPFIIPNSVVEVDIDDDGETEYVTNTKPLDMVQLVNYWGNGGSEMDGASLIDKSFVKLREVVISYSLPKKFTEPIHVSNFVISIVGKNLLLWTPQDQTYIDSELTTFGNDLLADFGEYGAQPSTRSLTLNLRIVF